MNSDVEAMKLEHNRMVEEGRKLYDRMEELAGKVNAIRDRIKAIAPDEHDEVMLLFAGVYEK